MVIDDHLNFEAPNRSSAERRPVRAALPRHERGVLEAAAGGRRPGRATNGLAIAHGVYVGLHGPSYETPAEIRALRAVGAMPSACRRWPRRSSRAHGGGGARPVVHHDMAAGVLPEPLDHHEVIATGQRVRGAFIALLEEIVATV